MNFAGESILDLAANPQVAVNTANIATNALDILANAAAIAANTADIALIRSVPDEGRLGVNLDTLDTQAIVQIPNITKTGLDFPLWIAGLGNVAAPNAEFTLRNSTTNIFFQSNNPGVIGSYAIIHRPVDDTKTITYRITLDIATNLIGLAGAETGVVQVGLDAANLALGVGPTYKTGPIGTKTVTLASNDFDVHLEYEWTLDWSLETPASDAFFIPVYNVTSAAAGTLDVTTTDFRDGTRRNRLHVEVVNIV